MINAFLKRSIPRSLRWQLRKWYLNLRGVVYRGSKVTCPCCEKSYRQFLPMTEGARKRAGVVCPGCAVVERHRLLKLWLQAKTDIYTAPHQVLYFAPEYSMQKHLRQQRNIQYLSTDIDSSLAMQEFDIMDIPHPDNSFSMIFCSHVLAHVKDDKKALRELHRILQPNGRLILLDKPHNIPLTLENPQVTSQQGRQDLYLQEDRWRLYGLDFVERVERIGFEVTEDDFATTLSEAELKKYVIDPTEIVYDCKAMK